MCTIVAQSGRHIHQRVLIAYVLWTLLLPCPTIRLSIANDHPLIAMFPSFNHKISLALLCFLQRISVTAAYSAPVTNAALDRYDPQGWTPAPTPQPALAQRAQNERCITTSLSTCGYKYGNICQLKAPSAMTMRSS